MAENAKHLVVFGCGYVGTAVARAARQRGWRVTALTRNTAKAAAIETGIGARCLVGELSTSEWHEQIPEPVDFVLNCVSSGGGGAENYRRSYVEGMRSVARWLERRQAGMPRFVYTSSTSVYPAENGPDVLNENLPVVGGSPQTELLIETENLVRAAVAASCSGWFVLRLAGIYGPGRHRLLDIARSGEWDITAVMDRPINLIHRDDIAAAIFACFSAGADKSGIYNAADGCPATRREILTWLAAQVGRPAPPAAPASAAQMRGRRVDAARLRAQLGWRPAFTDYRAGYAAILRADG